jgi:hypothetical protein
VGKKKRKKLLGKVDKVVKSPLPGEPEKAQITIAEADHLYREIRVQNVVTDEDRKKASLRTGEEVDVIIEADSTSTTKEPE